MLNIATNQMASIVKTVIINWKNDDHGKMLFSLHNICIWSNQVLFSVGLI